MNARRHPWASEEKRDGGESMSHKPELIKNCTEEVSCQRVRESHYARC